MLIVRKTRWTQKPPVGTQINRGHLLSQGLYNCWLMNEQGGSQLFDIGQGNHATLANGSWAANQKGYNPAFNGSTSYASAVVNYSDTARISVTFSLYKSSFANDDALAMELTANAGSNIGGFAVDPNESSSGVFQVFECNGIPGSASYRSYTRPSVGWHQYTLVLDFAAVNPVIGFYIDGVPQTSSAQLDQASSSMAASSTLYFMCRNATGLFATGNMEKVLVHKRALSASEAQQLYADPYCFLQPQSTRYANVVAAAGGFAAIQRRTGGNIGTRIGARRNS